MGIIIFSDAWSDGQWSCSMHARPLIWSQCWFNSYTLVSPIYCFFFCILICDFIFKRLVRSLSAMHGERISGAVACMHGRCFNLKAGFDLIYCFATGIFLSLIFFFFCIYKLSCWLIVIIYQSHKFFWHTHRQTHTHFAYLM